MATMPNGYIWNEWSGTTSGTDSAINCLYNSAVWDSWTTTSYTYATTSASTTAGDQIWYTWHDGEKDKLQALAQQQVYQEPEWQYWSQRYAYADIQQSPAKADKPDTARVARQQEAYTAAMRERIRRQEEQRREWKEIENRKAKAEATAKDMLLDIIGVKERFIYEKTGQVYVQGRNHGYIIKKYGYVKRIEGNGEIREFCVHLRDSGNYPDTDNVIALLMALKYDEAQVLKTANRKGTYPISNYNEAELRAACMPEDALKTKIELKQPAITFGEGIAA